MLPLIGLAIALFVSTNIDDVFLLIGFFADATLRPVEIIAGQYLGIAVLVGVSILASILSFSIPLPYIGLLGFAVIAIGVKKLAALSVKRIDGDFIRSKASTKASLSRIAAVTLVTITNGGDNIMIYIPSFAIHSRKELLLIVAVFVIMTAIWCGSAYSAVNHPKLLIHFQRYGRIASPLVLIALGMVVIFQAGTLGLLARLAH